MSIKIIHNPVELTYEQFIEIDKECFPYEPLNIEMFNEMKMNHIWIAFIEEKIVGYAHVKMESEYAHLSRIGVSISNRQKGIAKELINTIIKFCKDQNKINITLYVQTDNQPALNLYKEYGFISSELRSQFVIPIHNVITKYGKSVIHKLKAIPNDQNNTIKEYYLPKRYNLNFVDDAGNIYGNCCLDPEFPGCSHFSIKEPDLYLIDSLLALEPYLNQSKEELILTFKDTLIKKTSNNLDFIMNYELVKMKKMLVGI